MAVSMISTSVDSNFCNPIIQGKSFELRVPGGPHYGAEKYEVVFDTVMFCLSLRMAENAWKMRGNIMLRLWSVYIGSLSRP